MGGHGEENPRYTPQKLTWNWKIGGLFSFFSGGVFSGSMLVFWGCSLFSSPACCEEDVAMMFDV